MRCFVNAVLLTSILLSVGCAILGGGLRTEEARSPAWLALLPRSEGWLFAVGEAGPYFFDQKGWEAAEKNARENLALAIQARVSSEYVSGEGVPGTNIGVKVSREVLDVVLYGAQVLERYKDPATRYYYVLVGITASIAAENIMKAAESALKEKSEKETAENIRQKKDELIRKLEE